MGGISNTQTDDSEGNGSTSTSVNLLGPVFRAEIENESTMHGSSINDVDLNNYRNEPTMHGNSMVDVDLNNDPKDSTISQTKQRCIETQLLMLTPTMTTTMTSKTRWLISNRKRYIPHPLHQVTRLVWSKNTGEWKRRTPTKPIPHHRYGPVRYIRNDRVNASR
jgi:hypothetical protein